MLARDRDVWVHLLLGRAGGGGEDRKFGSSWGLCRMRMMQATFANMYNCGLWRQLLSAYAAWIFWQVENGFCILGPCFT